MSDKYMEALNKISGDIGRLEGKLDAQIPACKGRFKAIERRQCTTEKKVDTIDNSLTLHANNLRTHSKRKDLHFNPNYGEKKRDRLRRHAPEIATGGGLTALIVALIKLVEMGAIP